MNKTDLKTQNSKFQLPNSRRKIIAAWTIAATLLGFLAILAFPATSEAAVIRRAPNNLGLVGYWSFDDARGSTATDFSGNGNAGTLTNMDPSSDWVSGKRGTALDFDGNADYVSLNSTIDSYQKVTISAWIKLDSVTSDGCILCNRDSTGSGFLFWFDDSADVSGRTDVLSFFTQDTSGATDRDRVEGQQSLKPNQWYHVAAVFDDSADSGKIYIDGIQDNSDTVGSSIADASTDARIARDQDNGRGFPGKIDDVRIYNRALSASEIKDLHNAGGKATRNATADTLFEDKLTSHWTMDGPDVSGSTVKDVHGSNDGVLDGSPYQTDSGVLGQSYEFLKGDNSTVPIIDLGDIFDFTESDNFTIGTWVRPTGTGFSANHTVISKYPGSAPFYRIQVVQSSGDLNVELKDSQGDSVTLSEAAAVPQNTWKYVTAVVDRDTDTALAYVNGKQVDSADISSIGSLASDASVSIAGNQYNQYGMFGNIDDLRIYDAALSAEEVSRLYTATKPDTINSSQNNKLTDGLVGMWSFDGQDLSGSTAEDVSGNGNDGTLQNGPQPAIGRIGQALEFDTDSEEVRVEDTSSLLPSTVTACAWLKDTGSKNSSGWMQPIRKRQWDDEGYEMSFREDNRQVKWYLLASDGRSGIGYDNVKHNEWYHFCGTFDESISKLYVNGELEASQADDMGLNTTNTFKIGKSSGGVDTTLDNIRIYDRALSESEIERLYSLGR